jgi:hypothetical protein
MSDALPLSPDAVPGPGYIPPAPPVIVPPGAEGHTDLTVPVTPTPEPEEE